MPTSRICQIVVILEILLLSVSMTARASPIVQDTLVIGSNSLEYHGKRISIPIRRKQLIRAFGQPNRQVYDVAGNVMVWDNLGLSCFGCERHRLRPEDMEYMSPQEVRAYKSNDQIGALMIYLSKYDQSGAKNRKYNHTPALPYPGKVRLQGVDLDGSVTIKQFMALRNSKQTILLPNNSFSFYIRCNPAPQEITLYTIRDKYSDSYLDIYAVSIRNAGRFYKKLPCRENFAAEEKRRLELKKLEEENIPLSEQGPRGPLPVPAGENQ